MKWLHFLWIKCRAALGHPDAVLALKVYGLGEKNIHIYGLGEIGKDLIATFSRLGKAPKICGLYDSKAEYNPFDYNGLKVKGATGILLNTDDVLVIASVKFEAEIYAFLRPQLVNHLIVTFSSESAFVCAE